jgi:Uma2 family endonuclease
VEVEVMTATTLIPPKKARRASPSIPAPLRLTCQEFYDLGESGILGTRQLMLLDGEIWEKEMINPPHAVACDLTGDVMRAAFGSGWRIRIGDPLELSIDTDPEPDVAVVPGAARDYLNGHPVTAPLVLEISDSSLAIDLSIKLGKYAEAGIADYWVLDLNGRRLLVFRDPQGATYRTKIILDETQSISPLAMPTAVIKVADMLP